VVVVVVVWPSALSSQPASLLSPFVPVRCLVTDCFDPTSLLPQYTVVRTPRQKKSKRRRGTRNTTELTELTEDDVDDVGEGGRQHQHKRGPAGHKQYVAGAVNPSHVLYTNMARYEQVVVGAGFTGSHVVDVLMCLMASLTESYTDAVVHMKNVFVQSLFFFFLLLLFSFVFFCFLLFSFVFFFAPVAPCFQPARIGHLARHPEGRHWSAVPEQPKVLSPTATFVSKNDP